MEKEISQAAAEPPSRRHARLQSASSAHALDKAPAAAVPQPGPRTAESHSLRTRTASPAVAFRKRFFPAASQAHWNNWRWQLANRVCTLEDLERFIDLTADERAALTWRQGALPFAITPHYLGLVSPDNPSQAIRRCTVPTTMEHSMGPGESEDPLCEEHDSPVPGIVHRYPDRVLFLVTSFCSTYCRYCTRSRMVGGHAAPDDPTRAWSRGLDYIRGNPAVRDVLLSGGDPLTMADEALEWLLSRLRRIPHVEFVRLGTKTPAVLPQRITPSLTRMLRKYHPLWMSLHFAHPDELTPETMAACERLADAGIPLGSQTVLLKGMNDDPDVLRRLYHGLLRARVRPYYLYQCDPIKGSSHFRTTVDKGLEVISGLRGHTTGYAVPTYVIDAPGGGGKIPLYPATVTGRDEQGLRLVNYEQREFHYPDGPDLESDADPARMADAGPQGRLRQ